MGATGGSGLYSKLGVGPANASESSSNARDNASRISQFRENTKTRLGESTYEYLSNADPGITDGVTTAIEEAYQDYPDLVRYIKEVGSYEDIIGGEAPDNFAAGSSGDVIVIPNKYTNDYQSFLANEQNSVNKGWSPANTGDGKGTFHHEIMHIMQHNLADNVIRYANKIGGLRIGPGDKFYSKRDLKYLGINGISNLIVNKAIEVVQDNWRSLGFDSRPGASDLRQAISGYAASAGGYFNRAALNAETMAEAYMDYKYNGENSQILSQVIMSEFNKIYKLTKRD